jgi:hypothetical protein
MPREIKEVLALAIVFALLVMAFLLSPLFSR